MTYAQQVKIENAINERDLGKHPVTADEVIALFKCESSYMGIALEKAVGEAVEKTGNGDISARWSDYQEEIAHMLAELR